MDVWTVDEIVGRERMMAFRRSWEMVFAIGLGWIRH